ncbi:SdpI family protein [Acidithiobacillus sp. IBUN Pt1247-S3]|uniref:SdpI family protein n=1 Tax=Acidithiobacillus sp. IBUN Pt1247-S3 TaxID=3166642 RepID=UPI0034E50F11
MSGLIFIFIGLPLFFMKIPPNGFYGIRIAKAYESEESWYNVNKIGGGKVVVAGVILMVCAVLLLFVPQIHHKQHEAIACMISFGLAIAGGASTKISGICVSEAAKK